MAAIVEEPGPEPEPDSDPDPGTYPGGKVPFTLLASRFGTEGGSASTPLTPPRNIIVPFHKFPALLFIKPILVKTGSRGSIGAVAGGTSDSA